MTGCHRIYRSSHIRAAQSVLFRNNRSINFAIAPSIFLRPHAYSVQVRAFSVDSDKEKEDDADTKSKPQPRKTSPVYTQAQNEIRALRAGEAMGAMRQYFDKVKEKDYQAQTSSSPRETSAEGKTWMALRQEISKSAQMRNVTMPTSTEADPADGMKPRPRILNPRMGRMNTRPANQRAPSSSGAGDDENDEDEGGSSPRGAFKGRGGGGGGDFKGGRRDDDRDKADGEEDEDSFEMDAITKEMIQDVESFKEDVGYSRDGSSIEEDDERFISSFDKLLNDSFIESIRSPSGEFISMLDIDVGYKTGTSTENWRRNRLPRARPLRDLLEVVTPNIYSTEAGTEGFKVAQHAWDVMSKNYYFRESQKEYICNMIAKDIDEINNLVAMERQLFRDEDVLKITFYKGRDYLELEKDRNAAIELTQGISEEYRQGATDWQVQAVESEDDLFKDTSSK